MTWYRYYTKFRKYEVIKVKNPVQNMILHYLALTCFSLLLFQVCFRKPPSRGQCSLSGASVSQEQRKRMVNIIRAEALQKKQRISQKKIYLISVQMQLSPAGEPTLISCILNFNDANTFLTAFLCINSKITFLTDQNYPLKVEHKRSKSLSDLQATSEQIPYSNVK